MSAVWLCGSCLACGYTLKKTLAEQAFRMLAQRPGRHSFFVVAIQAAFFSSDGVRLGAGWAMRFSLPFPVGELHHARLVYVLKPERPHDQ